MLAPDILDLHLDIWARWVLSGGSAIKGLYYPSATPEHRYARRGGAAAPQVLLAPDMSGAEIAEQVDRVMARLRLHNELWFNAVYARHIDTGPDEIRAQRLKLSLDEFRWALYAGKRWLRKVL
jgi:hypothetical protein